MRTPSLIAIWVAATSIATQCFGQALDSSPEAKKERAELCQKVLCRAPTTVRVLLKDRTIMEVPFEDVSPIVLPNGWVTILPGEEVHITFDVDGDVLRNPRAVRRSAESQPTVSFRFSQDPETGDTSLVVSSTVNRMIKFDLGMMLPDSERVRKTSSCPVLAGKQSYEHWPYPIFQLVAARFRVLPPSGAMKCE
jgi:hypothetical protein